ncbi:MAG TPA: peptidoglycan-binding domain-containing protein [Gammaproteobacteria bacterium]|nr:peptidoglycan-binding domain-containing protein [Gammaproteobacteria bacterium]
MWIRRGLFNLLLVGGFVAMPAFAQQVINDHQAPPPGAESARPKPSINPATVRQVQQALSRLGYDVGAVDGRWSEQTSAAVRNFQQGQGLEPSGQLDTRTLGALGLGSDNLQQARPGGS